MQRLLEGDRLNRHRREDRGRLRFRGVRLLRLLGVALCVELGWQLGTLGGHRLQVTQLHVRPKTTGFGEDLQPTHRVDADDSVPLRRGEQLACFLHRQLIRREVLGHGGRVLTTLDVGPVPAGANHDGPPLRVGTDRDRVDLRRVDVAEAIVDHRLQAGATTGARIARGAHTTIGRRLASAEVELREPRGGLLLVVRDRVEVVLHPRGERVVDEVAEVLLQQPHHRERRERRDERRPLLPHVAAVLDGADDRCVRRRPTDAQVLERLHQRRLRETGRRLRGVARRVHVVGGERIARDE